MLSSGAIQLDDELVNASWEHSPVTPAMPRVPFTTE
jgi:hypothetical protein